MPEEKKIGRPTTYTPEIALEICTRIAQGESVRSICKDDKLPCAATIFNWLLNLEHKDFLEQYEAARNIQMELMFEELLDIADDGTNDWMEREGKDGETYYVLNGEAMGRSRLRVDVRKWYLSKVAPKKFGDKMDLTTDGKEIKGNNIVFTNFKENGANGQ